MKKIVLLVVAIATFSLVSQAQVNDKTLGLRLTNGIEGTFQKAFGSSNRLELDAGLALGSHYFGLSAAGMYHWVWNINEGLNWYVGPGVGFNMYSYSFVNYNYNQGYYNDRETRLGIGVGGQVGIEYDFSTLDVPLLVSLDYRPMFFFGSYDGFSYYGIGLGVRYIL